MGFRIKDLQGATLPLTGAELIEVEQGENSRNVRVSDLLPGFEGDPLEADLLNATDPAKGAAKVGWSGRTVAARLSDEVNVQDVWAKQGGGVSWNDVFAIAQDMLPIGNTVAARAGKVVIPAGEYPISGVNKLLGVVFEGQGTATRLYNNVANTFCFATTADAGLQDHGGFRNIMFDGGDPASTSGASRIGYGAINPGGMHAGFADGCIFQRFAGRAVSNMNKLSVKFEVRNCFATGNVIAYLMSDGMSTAFHMNECYTAFNDYGVLLNGQSDFHINNSIIEQNYLIGMRVDGTIDQGSVDGCYFEQNGAGAGGTKCNLNLDAGKSISVSNTLFNMLGSAAGSSGSGWGHIFAGDIDNLSLSDITFNNGAGITGFEVMGASGATKPIDCKNLTRYADATFGQFDALAAGRVARIAAKVSVPASATAPGRPGQWAADSGFYYAYSGDGVTHAWRRVALAAW